MGIECSVPGRSQSRDDLLPYPVRPRLTNLGGSHGRVTAHDQRPWDFTTGLPRPFNTAILHLPVKLCSAK
jgi:hypothetical protein